MLVIFRSAVTLGDYLASHLRSLSSKLLVSFFVQFFIVDLYFTKVYEHCKTNSSDRLMKVVNEEEKP